MEISPHFCSTGNCLTRSCFKRWTRSRVMCSMLVLKCRAKLSLVNSYTEEGSESMGNSCVNHFCILADETTDVAKIEQLLVIIWFMNGENNIMRRSCFLKHYGDGVANTIMGIACSAGLSMGKMIGFSFDGAASMFGRVNGAQAAIIRSRLLC